MANSEAREQFRERLRQAVAAWMEREGKTQEEFGVAIGAAKGTVSEWLTTDKDRPHPLPGGAHMLKLPGVLGVDARWLLQGVGLPQPVPEERVVGALRRILEIAEEAARPGPASAPAGMVEEEAFGSADELRAHRGRRRKGGKKGDGEKG